MEYLVVLTLWSLIAMALVYFLMPFILPFHIIYKLRKARRHSSSYSIILRRFFLINSLFMTFLIVLMNSEEDLSSFLPVFWIYPSLALIWYRKFIHKWRIVHDNIQEFDRITNNKFNYELN